MRTALGIRERTNSFSRLQLGDGAVGWCRVIGFYRGVQCVPREMGSDMCLRKAYSEALARLVTPDLASGVPVGGGTMDGSRGAITSLWSLGCRRAANTVVGPQRAGGEGG